MDQKQCHIGYVLKRFPRTSETFIINELLELERNGTSVEIFSLLEPKEEVAHASLKKLKAPVIYLPRKPIPLQADVLAVMARGKGITHLHAHFGTDATTVAMLTHRLTGIPYSFTAHAKDIYHETVDKKLLTEKISSAAFVITVSDYNRQHLLELAGENFKDKIIRLYNGIALDLFKPDETLKRETNLVLAVGRLVEKKGFRDLLEACKMLLNWGHDFKCLIIGEGPERESLTQQIKNARLDNCVTLAGTQPQEQVLSLMQKATMLVLPCVVSSTGDRDGLPTVLLEAMAAGLGVISTRISGIPEIIEDKKEGFLVEQRDSVALAKAMESVLTSPGLQIVFGRFGRKKAEKDFDVRKNVKVLRDLFTQALPSSTS